MRNDLGLPPRPRLSAGDHLVVKVGSSLLTSPQTGLDRSLIAQLADAIARLRSAGVHVVLVSSGAVAEGVHRLRLDARPQRLHRLQAAAAVGQTGLVGAYEQAFLRHDVRTALVLLTHADLASRERYLNASSTLATLLDMGVVPIVNENDTVATEEIRFGDNDTLGALVANLISARVLVMLTDQRGLHAADPREQPEAPVLAELSVSDPDLEAYCGTSAGNLGRGGMLTKVRAAVQAARSGTTSIIADGRAADVLDLVLSGAAVGTALHPDGEPLTARKGWLAGQRQTAGALTVDAGAARALLEQGRSLLPVGVERVEGNFQRGDLVAIQNEAGVLIANGLTNYSSDEARALRGVVSDQIVRVLGYCNEHALVHRDNLVIVSPGQPF
ncbi:MAG: glutamate 5-kinase [Pseudomonadota bacterium]